MVKNSLPVLFLLFSAFAFAQNSTIGKTYPQGYFRAPLDLPPSLSGTFGEIRSNHFHSGLDYRTNQREGYPVYASADGYVTRLRVQIGGGGNSLYLNHPNGYTTVYMHLQRFSPKIENYVKTYQYRIQQYDVDFPLMSIEIPVKQGEIIAWSGNTGGSAGPHLHFEIRETRTEETLNAQLFGINIPDKVRPVLAGMYVYRLNGLPFNENTPRQYFQLSGIAGNYRLNQSPVINISGEVGFGIMASDQNTPGGNRNGVYSIELTMDGQTIYQSALDGFFFHHSRAVNSHVDYPFLLSTGRTVQKSFVEPGNPLTIYKKLLNRGTINLTDDSVHTMQYTIKDAAGNTSTLVFKARFNRNAVLRGPEQKGLKQFYYNQDNEFTADNFRISIPKGSLYSDINFNYSQTVAPARAFSKLHHVHTRLIPLHDTYLLSIKPDSSLKADLFNKAIILDSRGISQGGDFDNGYIKASPKYFGNFYVSIDTIAPVIRPVTIADGKRMTGLSKITLKISDNLSGIKTFRGTIDGEWVLMEYDQKTSTLWHTFDGRLSSGSHTFKLVVSDNKLNSKTYTATFIR